jgi:hypothetical protein
MPIVNLASTQYAGASESKAITSGKRDSSQIPMEKGERSAHDACFDLEFLTELSDELIALQLESKLDLRGDVGNLFTMN